MANFLFKVPFLNSAIKNYTDIKKRRKILGRLPVELDDYEKSLVCEILMSGITMEPLTRLINTAISIIHVIEQDIAGDFVECGVYRGGQGALAAGIFKNRHQTHRQVLLFDTYTGAPEPGRKDIRISTGETAAAKWRQTNGNWMKAGVEEVSDNLRMLDVLTPNVRFIVGDVRVTMLKAENVPDKISVLRLDTNQYESTHAELETLYPHLSQNGVHHQRLWLLGRYKVGCRRIFLKPSKAIPSFGRFSSTIWFKALTLSLIRIYRIDDPHHVSIGHLRMTWK